MSTIAFAHGKAGCKHVDKIDPGPLNFVNSYKTIFESQAM